MLNAGRRRGRGARRRAAPRASSATSCSSSTSRASTSPRARWSAPRRCCAGAIRATACSRPSRSCRSPTTPACSCRSAPGCCARPAARAGAGSTPASRRSRVVVNVTSRQLRHGRLAEQVRAALEASGLPAESLLIEVPGDRGAPGARAARGDARRGAPRRGARLGVDDFGTGYASLPMLQRLRASAVCIDRKLIAGVPARHRARRPRPRAHRARARPQLRGGRQRRRDRRAARVPRRSRLPRLPGGAPRHARRRPGGGKVAPAHAPRGVVRKVKNVGAPLHASSKRIHCSATRRASRYSFRQTPACRNRYAFRRCAADHRARRAPALRRRPRRDSNT